MLQLIKIATLSAALSAGIVTAYGGARPQPATGAKAFYDRLPQAGGRDEAGLLRLIAPTNPRA
jgi:hypothetical protein